MNRLRLAFAEWLLRMLPRIAPRDYSGTYIREAVATYFKLRAESQAKLRDISYAHYEHVKKLRANR